MAGMCDITRHYHRLAWFARPSNKALAMWRLGRYSKSMSRSERRLQRFDRPRTIPAPKVNTSEAGYVSKLDCSLKGSHSEFLGGSICADMDKQQLRPWNTRYPYTDLLQIISIPQIKIQRYPRPVPLMEVPDFCCLTRHSTLNRFVSWS